MLKFRKSTSIVCASLLGCALLPSSLSHANYKSGFYGGITFGPAYNYNKADNRDEANSADLFTKNRLNSSSFDGGAFLGYIHRLNNSNYAVGAEFDFYLSSYRKSFEYIDPLGFANEYYSISKPHSSDLKFKICRIYNEKFMVYVFAGLAYCKINYKMYNSGTNTDYSRTNNLIGINYGVGIEKSLNERLRIGIEVQNSNYSKKHISIKDTVTGINETFKPSINSLKVGLRIAYSF